MKQEFTRFQPWLDAVLARGLVDETLTTEDEVCGHTYIDSLTEAINLDGPDRVAFGSWESGYNQETGPWGRGVLFDSAEEYTEWFQNENN